MHKNLDYSKTGGVWITQDVLAFMQSGYAQALDAVGMILGEKVVVYGVEVNQTGTAVSDGWVVFGGQLMPFVGGSITAYVEMETVIAQEQYDDGVQKDFYYTKRLRMVAIPTGSSFPFADLKRPGTFKNVWLTGDTKIVKVTQAYITANFDLNTGVALPNSERAGWMIDFEMSDRVPVGWSKVDAGGDPDTWDVNNNTMNYQGGKRANKITAANLPALKIDVDRSGYANIGGSGQLIVGGASTPAIGSQPFPVSGTGANTEIDNRQPFRIRLFLIKI